MAKASIRRAVIFDLDETLYPERRFMLSGFAAVAEHLQRELGVSAGALFQRMASHSRHRRHTVFQHVCQQWRLPETRIPEMVTVYRDHLPRLRLPFESVQVLEMLREEYGLGILTNGLPDVQRRKVLALGVGSYVDGVVYAEEHGSGRGKPDPVCFREILARLNVKPAGAVFVGDDPWCDIAGARQAGMRTIRIRRGVHSRAPVAPASDADVVVSRLNLVPEAVGLLTAGLEVSHVF